MTQQRSESEILLKTIRLHFGDKDYDIDVLRMKAAAKWREQYFSHTKEVADTMPSHFDGNPEDIRKAISHALFGALLKFPEKIPELVFSYAPTLPRDEIMEAAYDSDFLAAFKAIWGVAFEPFLSSLAMAMHMQKTESKPLSDPHIM